MPRIVRVAAAQHATGTDVEENGRTAVRMINAAADDGAQVVVLPEFGNHLSVYDDADHAWRVAVDLDGDWVHAITDAARKRRVWVQANATVRRNGPGAHGRARRITVSNLLVDPDGTLASTVDKTVLMGAENDHLSPAEELAPLLHTSFGIVGSYACMDGVVPEVPRLAAVRGAELMLNSLNSFALDEASLHIPVRAAESRVWVVACCKVGPLLPPDKIDAFATAMGIPATALHGAGESQIVAPDGTVVAQAPRTGEAVVVADIDLDLVGRPRPDGTDLRAARRGPRYVRLASPTPPPDDHARAEEITVTTAADLAEARRAALAGSALVVVPELAIPRLDVDRLREITAGTDALVVVATRDDDALVVAAVDADGLAACTPVMHAIARHPWARRLADTVATLDRPWGRLAIIGGDDLLIPEVTRLAALDSVDVVAASITASEAWDLRLAAPERSAENRVVVVASADGEHGGGVIADLPPDFTLWAPSRRRSFDGTINQPDVTRSPNGSSGTATVHPSRSRLRQISRGTDLVDGRPWRLCGPLTAG